MTSVQAGPVEALVDAVNAADLARAYALLSDDVSLAVPSLHGTLSGREHVTGVLGAVIAAFPDLRYTVSSRYVAPGQVTDEAVLTGIRLGPWGEVPPSGRPHLLPARIVVDHDGAAVTRIAVWTDAAALRATVEDRSDAGDTTGMPTVTALRATIPPGDPRVIVGQAREESVAAPVAASAAASAAAPARQSLNAASAKAAQLRAPIPRRVRRALVGAAAVSMTAATVGIVAWVVQGALAAPPASVGIALNGHDQPAASPPPSPSASEKPRKPPKAFTRTGNLITLNTDLTFASDSATLNKPARRGLAEIIETVRMESRNGTITVYGYTDSDGSRAHNMNLSRDRAKAVAAVLRRGLKDLDIKVKAMGFGEDDPKASNATEQGKAQNRRVEITVPGTG